MPKVDAESRVALALEAEDSNLAADARARCGRGLALVRGLD